MQCIVPTKTPDASVENETCRNVTVKEGEVKVHTKYHLVVRCFLMTGMLKKRVKVKTLSCFSVQIVSDLLYPYIDVHIDIYS